MRKRLLNYTFSLRFMATTTPSLNSAVRINIDSGSPKIVGSPIFGLVARRNLKDLSQIRVPTNDLLPSGWDTR